MTDPLNAILLEQRETNRLLKEIAGSLNVLLGKPPIKVRWEEASTAWQDGKHSIVQPK